MCVAVWYHYQIIRFTCCLNMLKKRPDLFACRYTENAVTFLLVYSFANGCCVVRETLQTHMDRACVRPRHQRRSMIRNAEGQSIVTYRSSSNVEIIAKLWLSYAPPPLYSSFFNLLFRIKTFWRDASISYNKTFLNAGQVKMLRFGL